VNENVASFDAIHELATYCHSEALYSCLGVMGGGSSSSSSSSPSPSSPFFGSGAGVFLGEGDDWKCLIKLYSGVLKRLTMKLFRVVAHIIRASTLSLESVEASLSFVKLQHVGNDFLWPDVVEDPLSAVEVAAMIGHHENLEITVELAEQLHDVMNLPIDVWAENSMKIRDKRRAGEGKNAFGASVDYATNSDYRKMDKTLTVNKRVGLFLNNNKVQSVHDYLAKYRYYLKDSQRIDSFRNNLGGRMVELMVSMAEFMRTTSSFDVIAEDSVRQSRRLMSDGWYDSTLLTVQGKVSELSMLCMLASVRACKKKKQAARLLARVLALFVSP